jgi:MtrB/PioB family decaheme-associated outer membrane protein
MNKQTTLIAAAVATVLGAASPTNAATGVDTSGWACESCPFYQDYEAELEVGGLYVDEDSARYGRYNGLDEKGGYADVSGYGGERRESGTYYSYDLIDLGLDTREATLEVGREGVIGATLSYDESPHNVWDTTSTPYARAGKDTLVLPGNWVRAGATTGMSALDSTLAPVSIGTDRSTIGLGLSWLARANVEVYADARQQKIEGNRRAPVVFLGQIAELPEPIDATHDQFELGAVYRWARGYTRLAWYASKYDNELNGLTFDNAYVPLAPDTVQGRKALAPDNEAQLLAIDGNFLLPWNGVLGYRLASGKYEQNASFLPISTSAALTGTSTLPRSNLDGEVSTANYRATLSLRPHSRLRLRGSYRYDERDDETAPFSVTYVETDSVPGGTATAQRYGYERTRFEGSAELRVLDWLFVAAGGGMDEIERSNQETAKTDETQTWGRIRLQPVPSFELSLTHGEARIDAGEYITRADLPPENPLLRKYNMANRDRDFYRGLASWSPGKFALTAEAVVSEDDYSRSLVGLQSSDDARYAGTVSYAINEKASVYATGGYQKIESLQAGAEGLPTTNQPWNTQHEDEFVTAGAGLRFDKVFDKVDITIDYAYARSEGLIETVAVVGGGAFPKLETELNSVRVAAGYDVNERLRVQLSWSWEDYDSSDWQLDGVEAATIRNLLSLGADAYRYDVNVVGLSFRYRFGGPKPEAE